MGLAPKKVQEKRTQFYASGGARIKIGDRGLSGDRKSAKAFEMRVRREKEEQREK
jgi:hypothetical protein